MENCQFLRLFLQKYAESVSEEAPCFFRFRMRNHSFQTGWNQEGFILMLDGKRHSDDFEIFQRIDKENCKNRFIYSKLTESDGYLCMQATFLPETILDEILLQQIISELIEAWTSADIRAIISEYC